MTSYELIIAQEQIKKDINLFQLDFKQYKKKLENLFNIKKD